MTAWLWRAGACVVAVSGVAFAWAASACDDGYTESETGDAGTAEAGSAEAGSAEAGTDAPRTQCALDAPFTSIDTFDVSINTTGSDTDPTVSADELTMVFSRLRADNSSQYLLRATRPSLESGFAPATALPGLWLDASALRHDEDPTLSADGQVLVFASMLIDGGLPMDLYATTLKPGTNAFAYPFRLDALSSDAFDEATPFLTADGALLFFASNRDGPVQLYVSARGSDGGFAPPARLTADGVPVVGTYPVLSADSTMLYFRASPDLDAGPGPGEIYRARRSPDGSLDRPVPVTNEGVALNLPLSEERPGWLSRDGCRFYFTSNRGGSHDIYLARRRP